MNKTYIKAITAVTAALAILGNVASDGTVTLSEGVSVALAFLGAFGVYQFPNEP